jgi:N-acetylneuraminate synthase
LYIIAEIAQAHEGSLGIAHSYIDALAQTGVDAVKFQTHIAEAESSQYEPFRVKFSYEDESRYDYWKRMEFTKEQWQGLKQHCEEKNLEFISSPFSIAAVELLDDLGVKKFKIGSGEVTNLLMLEKIAKTGKDIILSSGMSSYEELDTAVNFIRPFGNAVSLLQCTTAYPTLAGQWGLALIPELKRRYELPVGFSDHSGDIHASIAATALGAEILEFHAVFDKRMFGPDAKASLEIDQITKLVHSCREIHTDLQTVHSKSGNEAFSTVKQIFEKSLSLRCSKKKGEQITFDDLETKKPAGYGIDAKRFREILGKTLNSDKRKGEFLNAEDLNEYD